MDKQFGKRFRLRDMSPMTGFIAIIVMFVIGAILGAVTASHVPGDAHIYLDTVLDVEASVSFSTVMLRFLNLFKYHFIAFFFAFTFLGIFLIPLLTVFRGFFLAFSVTTVALSYYGYTVSLALFAIPVLFSIPMFLLMCVSSMGSSITLMDVTLKGQKKSGAPLFGKRLFFVFFLSSLVLFLGALLDCYITPRLLSYAMSAV